MIIENREKEYVEIMRPRRKGPISFNIKLTKEQKEAKAICYHNDITFLTGRPGTSKTTVACHVALDLLIKGDVGKIIFTRPTVLASKEIGFLPGAANDWKEGKLAPFLAPVLNTMYKLRSQSEIDGMIAKGKIEIVPIQFVRGLNFEDCVVVIDEGQNLTTDELKAVTSRLCKNAKMIFTSDVNQIDLTNKLKSTSHFISKLNELDGVEIVELTENFRSPLALAVMDLIDDEVKSRSKESI